MEIQNIFLKKNAQIYKKKKNFTNESLDEIITAATAKIVGNPLLETQDSTSVLTTSGQALAFNYRTTVFKTLKKVDFTDLELSDEIHGFITTVEIGDHLIILKKNCSNIERTIEKNLDSISHEELLKLASTSDTEIQKINLRNMTTSEKAIRGRQYEAVNLNGLISLHAAGRSIPHTMRVKQFGKIKSLTTTTARIAESTERQAIDEIAIWAKSIIEQLTGSGSISEFLSSFASPISLNEVLRTCFPVCILIESGALLETIQSQEIQIGIEMKNGKFKELTQKPIEAILELLSKCYEVENDEILVPGGKSARIKKNKKTITFNYQPLKIIKVFDGITTATLQSYIIRNKLYSICFNNPKYMYFKGACFEDKSGVSEINSILSIFKEQPLLNGATTEKGKFITTQTSFDSNSTFNIIEQIHGADDYIFCDDLGDEWADHITVNLAEKTVNFIHSKHGKETNGASAFHEVVGQGIKNIGNMTFTPEAFERKITNTFSKSYKAEKTTTSISRIRKGSATNFKSDFTNLYQDQETKRRCILACSFSVKKSIEDEFKKIKENKRTKGSTIQLLWIISSFIHATREANVIPVIYCRSSKAPKAPKAPRAPRAL